MSVPGHKVSRVDTTQSLCRSTEDGKSLVGLTGGGVQAIFEQQGGTGPLPAFETLEKLAAILNRPWAPGYKHGLWHLRLALRVILDDAPVATAAEARHLSTEARRRVSAYESILDGVRQLVSAGFTIPELKDVPPKTKLEEAVANRYHRDWHFVFNEVRRLLLDAGRSQVGIGENSPAVRISCALLAEMSIPCSLPALSKMLKRRSQAPPKRGTSST
jgi:hypothetical protein